MRHRRRRSRSRGRRNPTKGLLGGKLFGFPTLLVLGAAVGGFMWWRQRQVPKLPKPVFTVPSGAM